MEQDAITVSRRLLPRWRTLARTPGYELPASRVRAKEPRTCAASTLKDTLTRWAETQSLADAAEVIDAAILTGKYSLAVPAALAIVKDGNAVDGLNEAAKQVLGHIRDRPLPELTFTDEQDSEKIFAKIGSLKWRLNAAPRDALTALEIARLQSLLGQTASAERYVERAVKTAPNDRYVLRSAARFWAHRSRSDDEHAAHALDAIWASDVVRVDPWVQAAEVSLANICAKTPRWAVKTGREILKSEPGVIEYSELASGLAALEWRHGAMKKVRKLTKLSLLAPTENAVAQAMWSKREIGLEFDLKDFLNLPNANEARLRAAYEAEDYETAADECWDWLADERFSARAAKVGSYINATLLSRYDQSLAFAEQGLRANPSDPMLINSQVFSLAYLGKLDEAKKALPHLEAFEHDKGVGPYLNAARGLLSFRSGDYMSGRRHYERAIAECHEMQKPTLAAHATSYWLEQELYAGTADHDDARTSFARLDEFFNRKENAVVRMTIWTARKKKIMHLIGELDKRRAAQHAVDKLRNEFPQLTG